MFSWYVSKKITCKHWVEITLVQRCFSVVALKQHLRLFQPRVFVGYLLERQYRSVYEHRVPYVTGILLQSIKKSESS